MASDQVLREGVRQSLVSLLERLECGGSREKQWEYKQRFINKLRHSPIATETDRANEQHYEVPTKFFTTVLGPRLKYSSCYWPEGVNTLQQAEEASLKLICEKAKVEDGQKIMDLGCGWGSLSLYICEKFPRCHVTSVSNSNTQRAYIETEAMRLGYADRLHVITADANHFVTAERYDRIISIEMFEHMKNYELLLARVASWLKPAGMLFTQILCHWEFPYSLERKAGPDSEWMADNFFSGGTMPSADLFAYFQVFAPAIQNEDIKIVGLKETDKPHVLDALVEIKGVEHTRLILKSLLYNILPDNYNTYTLRQMSNIFPIVARTCTRGMSITKLELVDFNPWEIGDEPESATDEYDDENSEVEETDEEHEIDEPENDSEVENDEAYNSEEENTMNQGNRENEYDEDDEDLYA